MLKKIVFIFILATSVTHFVFSLDIDEARELLMAEMGGNIEFISRINLGIPGGENWIANRSDGRTYIYIINTNKEVYTLTNTIFLNSSEVRFWNKQTNTSVL